MNTKKILLVSTLAILTLFSVQKIAHAQENNTKKGETVIIGKNEVIADDVFATGELIRVEGTIDGDLYAAAETVDIQGTVTGDVLAAGGKVIVSGSVGDDVMAVGGTITLSGADVKGSVRSFGGTVIIDNKTTIAETLVFGAGEADINGRVVRNVVGGAGETTVNLSVGRDVWIGASEVTVGPDAVVGGAFKYSAENDAIVNGKAQILGGITRELSPGEESGRKDVSRQVGMGVGFAFWSYFAALLVGFVLLRIFGSKLHDVSSYIQKSPLKTFVWGFVSLLLTPVALFIIATTIVGIPLAIFLGFLFLFELYCAKIIVGLVMGEFVSSKLKSKSTNIYLNYAVGLLLVYILTNLGVFEFSASMIVLFLGYGAIILAKRELFTQTNKK